VRELRRKVGHLFGGSYGNDQTGAKDFDRLPRFFRLIDEHDGVEASAPHGVGEAHDFPECFAAGVKPVAASEPIRRPELCCIRRHTRSGQRVGVVIDKFVLQHRERDTALGELPNATGVQGRRGTAWIIVDSDEHVERGVDEVDLRGDLGLDEAVAVRGDVDNIWHVSVAACKCT